MEGRLGKDAETRTTRSDARFTVFSLANQKSWRNRESGEWQSKTAWFQVVCWGRITEYAGTLTKGTVVHIEGELTTREYVSKSGEKRTVTEIRAVQIAEIAPPKKDASETEGAAA
jgi:single-strand DNA-binding protein